jgi:hypothetical protein
MIDDPDQVERLLARMRAALPLRARMTPRLLATVRDQDPGTPLAAACSVTEVHYAGDEGGIVCHLARDGSDEEGKLVVTSITHLEFDPRLPLAREIGAYQKHRIKRLRRTHQPPPAGMR